MSELITIKEIAKITGKSEAAIRKHIRLIMKRNCDVTRTVTDDVTPDVTDVTGDVTGNVTSNVAPSKFIIQEKTCTGFTYKVDKEFVLRELNVTGDVTRTVTDDVTNGVTDVTGDVTGNVTSNVAKEPKITEVEFLRQELQKRNEQINLLIQAQERKDALIEKLRDRVLLLEAPKETPAMEVVPPSSAPQQKKGFFARLLKRQAPARTP